ncbi:MAG: hypothetical protein ABL920_04200 [Methylotenera sp.]
MISWGLFIFIAVSSFAMPFIGAALASKKVTFLRIWAFCVAVAMPLFYLILFIMSSYEHFLTLTIVYFGYHFPHPGVLLFGAIVGSVFAVITWFSMKYGH